MSFHVDPVDGSTEPELSTSPKGSASGSTSVQIPVSATVHRQAGGQQVANTNPQPDVTNTPIITGTPPTHLTSL